MHGGVRRGVRTVYLNWGLITLEPILGACPLYRVLRGRRVKTCQSAHLPVHLQSHCPTNPHIALNGIVRHTTCSTNRRYVTIAEWIISHCTLNNVLRILPWLTRPCSLKNNKVIYHPTFRLMSRTIYLFLPKVFH